ncbi:MAG: hypothetical protein J1F40_09945 [Prevotellaceae bacterium]|nr:hypothetical protein [Prevotellaceae bacterium]
MEDCSPSPSRTVVLYRAGLESFAVKDCSPSLYMTGGLRPRRGLKRMVYNLVCKVVG